MFVWICHTLAFSQTYPVQTFVQVSPPHTSYLPDYSDPFSNQMKIFLTLTDFTVPSYQVKLRFTLTGNGYSITTSSLLNLPTTTLSPGSPVEISGSDLAPYLSSQNLLFSGIDVADYEIRKVLPEGPCQICVEVIDFSNPNQAVLSNPACTQVWFSLNDPPLLNTPFCGNQITPTDPQQLIFSWTPLHMNSLHSAGTNYVFELFEIRPDGADPNQVVNSSLPIFMQVTDQTFINYGITEPQLQTGMSYVWRVRAQDIQGRDFFRNNGYSSVCTFTYGNIAASLADGITLTLNTAGTGTRKGDAWWNVSATFTSYKVEVRKTGNPEYEWFPYESTTGELKIYQLEPATQYECRVKGLIGTEYESEWSNISVFTTQPLIDYACGSTTQPPGEINFTPLTNAIAGLTFEIGQFELLVTDIEPLDPILQPGHYRGTGKIAVGFAIINIRVSFDDILVDDNLKVRSGKVEAITEGMDAWLAETSEPDYYVDGTITDFEWNDSTSLTVWVDGVPQTFSFADHDPLVIQDEDGMVYSFNSDGTYTVISILIYSTDALAGTADYRIDFSKDENQVYGFDKKEYAAWLHDYEVIRLLDSTNYFVSYKSLAPDQTDYVIANVTSENPLSNVTFVAQTLTGTSNLASQQINDSTYRVTLAGMSSSFYVYAEDDGNRIGKLWVKVLPAIEKEIVFVPVNGASLSQISELELELNAIYKQANVSFEVDTKSNYQSSTWDLNTDGKLQTGDVDLMSHYSEEMRLLRDEYFASDTGYNKNAYYIFIIPEFLQDDLGGYMVRGKGVGFLKNGESPRTAAHELAHGIFALEHTFPAIEEGSTENLLDYSNGTHLAQKQWYYMHNPLPAFSFLDDEEEGELRQAPSFLKYYHDTPIWVNVDVNHALPLMDGTWLKISGVTQCVFDINGKVYRFRANDIEYRAGLMAVDLVGDYYYYSGYFTEAAIEEIGDMESGEALNQKRNAEKFKGFISCSPSTTVYCVAPKLDYGVYSDCLCEWTWTSGVTNSATEYNSVHNNYPNPVNVILEVESEIEYTNCSGECIDYSTYNIDGPAEALFVFLAPKVELVERDELALVVQRINEEALNKTFCFFSIDGVIAPNKYFMSLPATTIETADVFEFFLRNEIFNLEVFEEYFGVVSAGASDVQMFFAKDDLWDGIPSTYNVNSIDYVKNKIGITAPYIYSSKDLAYRELYELEQTAIFVGIQRIETDGVAVPIYLANGYEQYVAQFGTNSAFYSLLGSFVQTMGPVFIAYGGLQIVGAFGTVTFTPFQSNMANYIKTYIGHRSREAILTGLKSYFAYVLIDATLRVVCDLSPNYPTALLEVNQSAAMLQGATDGVATYMNLPDLDLSAFQAISNCVVGIVEGSGSGQDTQINNCLFGALVSVLVSSSGNIKTILFKRILALSSQALETLKQKLLNAAGLSPDHWIWSEVFGSAGALAPNSLISKIYQEGVDKLNLWMNGKNISFMDESGDVFSGTIAQQKIYENLESAIGNKNVLESLIDEQGRFSLVLERVGQANQVVSIHPTSSGVFKITTFEPAYNPSLNPDTPAPVSTNRLVPDYAGTPYIHPDNQGIIVRIELSGNRTTDFNRSRLKLKELLGLDPTDVIDETGYTWHHFDDFEVIDGKAYSTMQLVQTSAHQGAGVYGMQHSGSAAQWRAYFGSGY